MTAPPRLAGEDRAARGRSTAATCWLGPPARRAAAEARLLTSAGSRGTRPAGLDAAMYQDTAGRLYLEEGPAGAASREACRGNDRRSVIQLRTVARPPHAIRVVSVRQRPWGIQPPTFAIKYCRRARCPYRTDRGGSRPPHQLSGGALDARADHTGSRRGGCLLGIRRSDRRAPLAWHETAARRGGGHNHGARLSHRFPGHWIRVVAA